MSRSEFSIPITTPSGKDVRVPGITNRDYLDIIKYCANNDYEGLESLFESIIFNKIPVKLNCIDKFYILIVIRIFFVDENIVLQSKDKEVNLSLHRVLTNLDTIEFEEIKYEVDDLVFDLELPDKLYYRNFDDYLSSSINKITIKNKSAIDFSKISNEERNKILTLLPNRVINVFNHHINKISEAFKDFTLVEENKVFNLEGVSFNLISSNLISFISSIFSFNILSFFEMLYVFISKMKSDSDLFYSLSPIDSKIMLNILSSEIERENNSLKNETSI